MKEDGDGELFRQFVGDVEPLKQPEHHQLPSQKGTALKQVPELIGRRLAAQEIDDKTGNYLASEQYITPVKPWDILSFKRDGVQHGVFRNLKQGRYNIEATIDLHRRTVRQARADVFEFLGECVERDIRCAAITHGKGQHRDPPALLKSCVNHWLVQMDEVLAFHSAPANCGGSGTSYVLLRKSPAQKEKNRVKFTRDSESKESL